MKTSFVVIDGNMLCYTFPTMPSTLGILASSVIKGANVDRLQTEYPTPSDKSRIRPATRQDFTDFRVSPNGYQKDTERYDFPAQ